MWVDGTDELTVEVIDALSHIVRAAAGRKILAVYRSDFAVWSRAELVQQQAVVVVWLPRRLRDQSLTLVLPYVLPNHSLRRPLLVCCTAPCNSQRPRTPNPCSLWTPSAKMLRRAKTRLPNDWAALRSTSHRARALRTDYTRPQAPVEIDVLAAKAHV